MSKPVSSITINTDAEAFVTIGAAEGAGCNSNVPASDYLSYRVQPRAELHLPFPSPWVSKSATGASNPCFIVRHNGLPGRLIQVQMIGTFN